MEKRRLDFIASKQKNDKRKSDVVENNTKGAKGDCGLSASTSHTNYNRKLKYEEKFKKVTREQFNATIESISGTSDSFGCVHGMDGKLFTQLDLMKKLDPIPFDAKRVETCPRFGGSEVVEKLKFLFTDHTFDHQLHRIEALLKDLILVSEDGFKIDMLRDICIILDFMVENLLKIPSFHQEFVSLLHNMKKPILLISSSDFVSYFDAISDYFGYVGYLLIRLVDDDLFDLVSDAIRWHLMAPDQLRKPGTLARRHTLSAAAPALYHTLRMLAVASDRRFPTFLEIAMALACDSVDNCIELMKENIVENIFDRFNPYYPDRELPIFDIVPIDPLDINVKLGASTVNMSTIISLLMILLKTTLQFIERNPKFDVLLPCPDSYAQRCFVWAYRYECRARNHKHERIMMTIIAAMLLKCFRERVQLFSVDLMPVVLSLSVLTELPPRSDWIGAVNFNVSQIDVQFKRTLISFSVDLIKIFPRNRFMIEDSFWMLGLMYLLDPELCYLRTRWSPALFAEIRKTAFQALVCTVPICQPYLVKEYGLIRRLMWYIEWYSEVPYELSVLFWCVRLLEVAVLPRYAPGRKTSLRDLFDTHGIIIFINLCCTLLDFKTPPVEKRQVVIALSLRVLTSAVEADAKVKCVVYPNLQWPASVLYVAERMLEVVLFSLEKHFILSDRWLISLLNFIWEAIVWKTNYRNIFISNNGVYKLLDIVTMTRPPVQCIALALICDLARSESAVGQLVTWRANLGASNANPVVVKRGATIAALLASIFRDECQMNGVSLDEYDIIQDLEFPLTSLSVREEMFGESFFGGKSARTVDCLAAADLAGSRMSKAYAILHLLSEDLKNKVSLADEAYNLYKNIPLKTKDEVILVLCSFFLTFKLNDAWAETRIQNYLILPEDEVTLKEFNNISAGWAKEVKRQQEEVVQKRNKKAQDEEHSLYKFLGRVRLNVALDALREVRCITRSTDRGRLTLNLINDAVLAHHRRSTAAQPFVDPVVRTYEPSLDDQSESSHGGRIMQNLTNNYLSLSFGQFRSTLYGEMTNFAGGKQEN